MDNLNNYYDKYVKEYFESTVSIDMSELRNSFISRLSIGGRILDVGCGSGRDSKAFLDYGFDVLSIDSSSEMCEYASRYIGKNVINKSVLDIKYNTEFDGVWASASLLHLPKDKQKYVVELLVNSLKINGILYASWKYGLTEHYEDGRFFCDMTEKSIINIVDRIDNAVILEIWRTADNKPNSNEEWINLLIQKVE